MKKIIILIPVFNDWESLRKLLGEIDINIKGIKDFLIECYVINDASTIDQPKINKPENINSLKILNMRINKGHARCNAFGVAAAEKQALLEAEDLAARCSILTAIAEMAAHDAKNTGHRPQ